MNKRASGWTGLALLLAATAAQADPADEILAARNQFLDNAPYLLSTTPEPQDLESFLLNLSATATLALINQVEGSGNRAEVEQQEGAQNMLAVFQGFGDNNRTVVQQTGNSNLAVLTQSGSTNQLALEQLGNDNIARSVQQGSDNRATVNQYGDRNELTLQQLDSYNDVLVNQYGDTVLAITQTNPGGSVMAQNELSVSAHVEAGYVSNFGPIQLDGPGQTAVSLCSGSAAYCAQY